MTHFRFGEIYQKIRNICSVAFLWCKRKYLENPVTFIRGSAAFVIGFVIAVWYLSCVSAPVEFPKGIVVSIPSGTTLLDIGDELYNQKIVRSPFWFRFFVIAFKNDKGAIAGDYVFSKPANAITIAKRIALGRQGFETVKVTIPEGFSVSDIAFILDKKLDGFDEKEFMDLAKSQEGYLFPETYFFELNTKPEVVVDVMTEMFDKQIKKIEKEIKDSDRSLDDLVKMASLLEGEARTMNTRQVVAGILWKRLDMGMPLQVDTVFQYINGKDSFSLTKGDLIIDSPYNLYKIKGLPPTPISNPGLDALLAAATPIKTNYLYFLTDKNGVMHYSANFTEHTKNKEKYLR